MILLSLPPVLSASPFPLTLSQPDFLLWWQACRQEAVKQLPTQYREVIHLHYYEGYSTEEMAKILGRNPSTIRSDLRRGREKLKSVLKEAYDFEV